MPKKMFLFLNPKRAYISLRCYKIVGFQIMLFIFSPSNEKLVFQGSKWQTIRVPICKNRYCGCGPLYLFISLFISLFYLLPNSILYFFSLDHNNWCCITELTKRKINVKLEWSIQFSNIYQDLKSCFFTEEWYREKSQSLSMIGHFIICLNFLDIVFKYVQLYKSFHSNSFRSPKI